MIQILKSWFLELSGGRERIRELMEKNDDLRKELSATKFLVPEKCKSGPWCKECVNSIILKYPQFYNMHCISEYGCKLQVACQSFMPKGENADG